MHLPETGFIKLETVVGNPKKGIPALIPIGRTSWYRGVRDGRYPKPVRLGPRTSAYQVSSIRALIASLEAEAR